MFGLALRTYQRRMQHHAESVTMRGQSLWEAVFSYLQGESVVTRSDVLRRFHQDDEAMVRAVLQDLTETGLVFRSGTGNRAAFRAASAEELG